MVSGFLGFPRAPSRCPFRLLPSTAHRAPSPRPSGHCQVSGRRTAAEHKARKDQKARREAHTSEDHSGLRGNADRQDLQSQPLLFKHRSLPPCLAVPGDASFRREETEVRAPIPPDWQVTGEGMQPGSSSGRAQDRPGRPSRLPPYLLSREFPRTGQS